jgi:hypothetical protein
MTARTLVSILLRLWGALWALGAILSFPRVLLFAAQAGDSHSRHLMLGNAVIEFVWLVLGFVLFIKNEQIAAALFPTLEGELSISATSSELQEVGFSLLAIYFGVGAVARLAGLIYEMARASPFDDRSRFSELAQRNAESLVSTAAQVLVCILLFFGSHGLAALWRRVRGNEPASDEPGDI